MPGTGESRSEARRAIEACLFAIRTQVRSLSRTPDGYRDSRRSYKARLATKRSQQSRIEACRVFYLR